MTLNHSTIKAPGQPLYAVADWNAGHVLSGNIGEIPFQIAAGQIGQDSNLFWDNTNKRLGIGTTSPLSKLSINVGSANGVKALGFFETGSSDTFYFEGNFLGAGPTGNWLTMKDWGGHDVMTWRGDGNVGIGTTTPTQKLEVYENGANVQLMIHENAGTHSSQLRIRRGADDWYLGMTTNNNFRILHEANNRFHIDGVGNVGISTPTPGARLHVVGTDGIIIPIGTTAQRVATQGIIRYNTDTSKFEGYDGAAWQNFH